MATKSNSKTLEGLVINKVASSAVFSDMVSSSQVNEDELYLIEGDEEVTYTLGQDGSTITLTGTDGSTSSVSADPAGAATSAVSSHNTSASAHADIRNAIPTKTSQITNDSGYITTADIPEGAAASTTIPVMDGTAATGTELAFARGDHVHPTDTSRAAASEVSALKTKLDGIESGAQVNTVTSVNSKTGTVTLTYSDVGAAASSHGTHVSFSTTKPVMDGTASVGSAATVSRSDHVHPTDTSRASASDVTTIQEKLAGIESGAQVNTVTSVNDKTGAVSLTYTDVGAAAASHGTHVTYSTTTPSMDGTASAGTASTVSRSDHIHPTDTSRAPTSHASSGTTYGKGTSSDYGHVKLSDSTTATTSAASGGTAATPKAVSDALDAAKNYADGISDNNFTDALKTKLDGIAAGAQVNTVTSVNEKTGAVSLTYSDVGAAASSHGTHVTFDTSNNPKMDGTAAKGTATTVARSDHVHPSDTSRVPTSRTINGKALSGDITLSASDVGAAATNHGTHVTFDTANKPKMDGTAATGTATTVARSDHVHPTDTSRASAADLATLESAVANKADADDIPTKTSQLTNDSGFITTSDIPEGAAASTTSPKMDGTATVGTELAFARGDHIHPTDTSRAPTSHASTATTYGVGSASNYGHVKLSDSTTTTTSTTGTAATPKAVGDALSAAKSYADGITDNNFTDDDKSKLDGIQDGAQVNAVTSVNSKTGAVSLTYSDVGAAASSHGTHVTYSTTAPAMDGMATVGTAATVSRSDHVHPTDTSRAAASDLSSHTSNTTVHVTSAERSAWNAKQDALSAASSTSDGYMTKEQAEKLAGISESADAVSVTQTLTSGTEIGSVTINGTATKLYAPPDTNTTYTLTQDATDGHKITLTPSTGTATTITIPDSDNKVWYATCPTGAGVAEKVVTTSSGDFTLATGATVFVKFTNTNTSTSATLKIDGKTAKSIKQYGTTAPTAYSWAPGAIVCFVYDGTNFIQHNGTLASTTYYGAVKLSDSVTSNSTSLAATANAVKQAYDLANGKQSALTFDTTPTSGSSNPVTSGGVYSALSGKANSGDIPTKTSDLTNDSGFITTSDIPEGAAASTTSPKMDGTATVGTELAFARGDHIHPTDTSRAPTSHASTATTYGTGTNNNYGHVKLSDSTSASTAASNGGTAATPKAVSDALTAAKTYADGISANDFTDALKSKLDGIETGAQVNTVTSVNSKTGAVSLTYSDVGAAARSHGTHVTYSTAAPAMDGTAAVGTAATVSRSDHVHPTDASRAPTSHASSATTYGTGTNANYGHVKLSDATTETSAASNGGTAATPKAVSDALTSAKSYTDEVVENLSIAATYDAETKNLTISFGSTPSANGVNF